jgi:hypothetical protein
MEKFRGDVFVVVIVKDADLVLLRRKSSNRAQTLK